MQRQQINLEAMLRDKDKKNTIVFQHAKQASEVTGSLSFMLSPKSSAHNSTMDPVSSLAAS